MLRRITATQKVWSNERFQKVRKMLFSSILAQGPLLRKLAKDPSGALQRMKSQANTDMEKWLAEQLKRDPSNAFDTILAHALVSEGCEERILGESITISRKEELDMDLARFALIIGNAWDETLASEPRWNTGPRAKFKDPLNPVSMLFSIAGDSEQRMGYLVTLAVEEDAFIGELKEGKISEMGIEMLRGYYELPIKCASIVDGGTIMMKVEGKINQVGVGRRTLITVSEKKIERFLEQIAKRLTVGFSDSFGKNV